MSATETLIRSGIARFVTEYTFSYTWPDGDKRTVQITRHSNHGDFIEDGGWVVVAIIGSMNPWYLSTDGTWRYKCGERFESAQVAYDWLRRSESFRASYEKSP